MVRSSASELTQVQQLFDVLVARREAPHVPVADDALGELDAIIQTLPFQAALELPPDYRRRRLSARGQCDALLKRAIVNLVEQVPGELEVLNHCSVFGRHGRELARRLDRATVVAADISSVWDGAFRLYERLRSRPPAANYRFVRENVFDSEVELRPILVCFFGACGALADGAIDLAVRLDARYIVGRACCQCNIAMNGSIDVVRHSLWGLGHRVKNQVYRRYHRWFGSYFDRRYDAAAYPRSAFARGRLGPDQMVACARHAVDCVVCRGLIDVDRLLRLEESGYGLLAYRDSMFIAERNGAA